jgi:hypothetical protein
VVVIAPPVLRPVPVPPRMPRDYGYVELNVLPSDAYVYVDDEYRGIARNFSCSPDCLYLIRGKYSITLKKEGYKTERFIVHVVPGRLMELDANLDLAVVGRGGKESIHDLKLEKTGYLELNIEPQDASVYIDGGFFGVASQFSESQGPIVLESGTHKIEIVKPGFEAFSTDIEISKEKKEKLSIKMKRSE